jgi:hypothetical protein
MTRAVKRMLIVANVPDKAQKTHEKAMFVVYSLSMNYAARIQATLL